MSFNLKEAFKQTDSEVVDNKVGVGEAVGKEDHREEDFALNALSCFGWKESKTDKWLIKCAYFWYAIMSFFWFLFGAITFAPIIFMSNKVNVIFKSKKKSLLVSIGIYSLILFLIVLAIMFRNIPHIATP